MITRSKSKMNFIVDTAGDSELHTKSQLLGEDEKPYFVAQEEKTKALLKLFETKKEELDSKASLNGNLTKNKNSKVESLFDKFFDSMEWNVHILRKNKEKGRLFNFDQLDKETGKLLSGIGAVHIALALMRSCVIAPGFEQQQTLPSYHTSGRKLKAQKKKEQEKTKGPSWFNMPAPEVTEEMKNDLQVLKMRSAVDPKRFYKKNDMEVTPKYFQVGRIMDSPLDHVNERISKKKRKRTMVDELLDDAESQKYNKKKFKQIIDDKKKSDYRTHVRAKRQRNKQELKKTKMAGKKLKANNKK